MGKKRKNEPTSFYTEYEHSFFLRFEAFRICRGFIFIRKKIPEKIELCLLFYNLEKNNLKNNMNKNTYIIQSIYFFYCKALWVWTFLSIFFYQDKMTWKYIFCRLVLPKTSYFWTIIFSWKNKEQKVQSFIDVFSYLENNETIPQQPADVIESESKKHVLGISITFLWVVYYMHYNAIYEVTS